MDLESLSPKFREASLQEQIRAIKLFFQKHPEKYTAEDFKNALRGLKALRKEMLRSNTNN